MKNVVIIGLGLMGGSLGLTIKKQFKKIKIFGICEKKNIENLKKKNFLEDVSDKLNAEFIKIADIIIVCTPVSSIPAIINQISPNIKENAIITDIGSIKNNIYKNIKKIFLKNYIGSHPMTGSEKSGVENAYAELYDNAVVILTPDKNSDENKITYLKNFWEKLHCETKIVDIQTHDLIVAHISHLPHLTAAALINTNNINLKSADTHIISFAGGGFKDSTRIASGNPELWTDICFNNKSQIMRALNKFIKKLNNLKNIIENNNKHKFTYFLSNAKKLRDTIPNHLKGLLSIGYELIINVPDEIGILAKIAKILAKHNVSIKFIEVMNVREGEQGAIKIGFKNEIQLKKAYDILIKENFQVFEK